ncbi:MAG: EAL domain-containing protein [Firmicutes bacterium]|nr:EAL domain-containing protein [Bacillota bacterium]
MFCLLAVTGALVVFEASYPSLITGYKSGAERLADVSFGLVINMIYNALLFGLVTNNYNKEHKKVKDYLARLKTVNEQLQREMTERREAELALRESENKYKTIFQTTGTAVIIIEENGLISLVNQEFEKLSGYCRTEVEGKISWKLFFEQESAGHAAACDFPDRHGLTAAPASCSSRFIDRHGNIKHVLINISVIPGTKKTVASFVDISTIKQAEAQLKYLATHDYLTAIPNRYAFEETLQKAVAKAKRGRESVLLFIDIDNFKLVNDTQGHSAGDDLLISVAKTLKENLRGSDTLARLGGDEFAVLLEETSAAEGLSVAEKLRRVTEESEFCLLSYGRFNLSLSIGLVVIDGSLDSQKLLALADAALYTAKEKGRNRIVLLDPKEEITSKYVEINRLIAGVKSAVKEDGFVLLLQPVVRVESGETVHHEALVRLRGENGELISPHVFIPVAERFGLMPQIDRWVIEASLNALRRHPGLNLFANLSGISLNEELLLDNIEQMITRSGIEPFRIGFEITETAAVKDMLAARRWIERLKKTGCRFALDDFGTGFSSFSYLRMLPVDYLKIDGSFIRSLDKDPAHRAMVKAISTIALSLNKKVVAECVENGDILKILREQKIDYAQGYYLGAPAPLERL